MTFLTLPNGLLKKMGLNKILDRPNLMPVPAIIPSPDAAVIFAFGCVWFSVL